MSGRVGMGKGKNENELLSCRVLLFIANKRKEQGKDEEIFRRNLLTGHLVKEKENKTRTRERKLKTLRKRGDKTYQ